MLKFGAIFRSLALFACLVPFTSAQRASVALAPFLPVVPAPAGEPSGPPVSKEEDEREEREEREETPEKQRHAPLPRSVAPAREQTATLPAPVTPLIHLKKPRSAPPSAADPFRNGLGTPYRC